MNRRYKVAFRAFVLLWTTVFGLNACATAARPSSPSALTPQEERMRAQAADFNRTITEGVVAGALGGAAAGAGIGALANKRNRSQGALIGAAIGALAGALMGGAAGKYYADKKERYANQEQRLDAIIADLQKQNAELNALVDSTRTVVDADKRKIDDVSKELAANKISKQEARQRLASVEGNCRFLSQTIATLKQRHDEWKQVADQARAEPTSDSKKIQVLDGQINRLEQQITLMQGDLDALNSRRVSVVG